MNTYQLKSENKINTYQLKSEKKDKYISAKHLIIRLVIIS